MTDSPPRSLSLAALAAACAGARTNGDLSVIPSGVAHDSRGLRAGNVFVALRGDRFDGHSFLAQAIEMGACAVVIDEAFVAASAMPSGVTALVVADTRRALSRIADAFYGAPSQALRMTGVTGTNGKTTTTHLIAALLEAGGIAAGRIGTLGAHFGGAMWSLDNTTPLSLELQRLLGEMRDRGARAVAMEVSSHALALDRVADVVFEIGVLTNVTRDHLDFHGSFEAYAAVKRSLFEGVATSVLNVDDAHGSRWAAELSARGAEVVTYALERAASIRACDVALRSDGTDFVVDGLAFTLRLPGRFNVHNALAALAVARLHGVPDAVSAAALAAFERVPGRMEHIAGRDIDVLVDYAHTPDALEVVLRAARETARGRLIVVFGCGGDRDRGKRPEMGRIASVLADAAIVTSDNPRSEAPQAVVADILTGIGDAKNVTVLLDRRTAIRRAILDAAPGDLVVVAGKGHETYQIVGTVVNHFDDRDEVRGALAVRAAESMR